MHFALFWSAIPFIMAAIAFSMAGPALWAVLAIALGLVIPEIAKHVTKNIELSRDAGRLTVPVRAGAYLFRRFECSYSDIAGLALQAIRPDQGSLFRRCFVRYRPVILLKNGREFAIPVTCAEEQFERARHDLEVLSEQVGLPCLESREGFLLKIDGIRPTLVYEAVLERRSLAIAIALASFLLHLLLMLFLLILPGLFIWYLFHFNK